MKRFIPYILVVVLLSGVFLFADKPWKDKPYTEWTVEQVQKVLFDSPWAKKDSVGVFSRPRGQSGQPGMSRGGRSGGRGGGSGGGSAAGDANQAVRQLYWIQCTWVGDPIRQAYARASELAGQELGQVQSNPEIFQFFIQGDGLKQLVRVGDESVQNLSYMKPKKGDPISPIQVVFREPFDQEPLIMLAFPAEIDGKPAITLDNKEVEVVIQLGEGKLKAKFKLKDMVIDGELKI